MVQGASKAKEAKEKVMTIWQIFKLLEHKRPGLFVTTEEGTKGLPLVDTTGTFLQEHGLSIMPLNHYQSVLFLTERAREVKVTLSKRPHTTHKLMLRSTKSDIWTSTVAYMSDNNLLHICDSSLEESYKRIPSTLYLSIPPTKETER